MDAPRLMPRVRKVSAMRPTISDRALGMRAKLSMANTSS